MTRDPRRSLRAGREALRRPPGSSRFPVGYVPPDKPVSATAPTLPVPSAADLLKGAQLEEVWDASLQVLDMPATDLRAMQSKRESKAKGFVTCAMHSLVEGASYPAIARVFGHRHHSTCHHAARREFDRDPAAVTAFIAKVRQRIEEERRSAT